MTTLTMPAPRATTDSSTHSALPAQGPEFPGRLMLAALAAVTVAWVAGWVALAALLLPAAVTIGITAAVAALLAGGLTVTVFAEASGDWTRGASYTREVAR